MTKFKIGKQPRRLGGPSDKFLARKAEQKLAAAKTLPKEGLVRLYLDDERPCPEGWTLARTEVELWKLFDQIGANRIEAISLDWYLGAGYRNGEAIAERLLETMRSRPELFSALICIGCHNSDYEKAINMARTLEQIMADVDDLAIPLLNITIGFPHRLEMMR